MTSAYKSFLDYAVVFIISALIVTLYEILKEVFSQGYLTTWESHSITILITALLSTISSVFISKKFKQKENELFESEARFREIAENISEVFWITEPNKQKMLYISPGYERIWGLTRKSLYENPMTFMEAIVPEDRDRINDALARQKEVGGYCEEYRITKPDGNQCWIFDRVFPVKDSNGKVVRIVGIAEDITERKIAQNKIKQLAITAQLTGLSNRYHFNKRFDDSLNLSKRQKNSLALLSIDLDKFKYVNDTYGHPVGDALLKKVAAILRKCSRETDIVARIVR